MRLGAALVGCSRRIACNRISTLGWCPSATSISLGKTPRLLENILNKGAWATTLIGGSLPCAHS